MRSCAAVLLIATVLLGGCREGDGPADPSAVDARIYLVSSPNGALVSVDRRSTGRITPDTVPLRRGDRLLELELDSMGFTYDYSTLVRVERMDTVMEVTLPLAMRCASPSCLAGASRQNQVAGLSFVTGASGAILYSRSNAPGIAWPAATNNRYVVSGMPVMAARINGTPVALGVYDQSMLVGLPAPTVTRDGDAFLLTQHAWILPSSDVSPGTLRGVLVGTEIRAHESVPGALVLRITFTNVSDNPLIRMIAPQIPAAPVTYTHTWIGIALDPDIGTANDDWISYDVDQDMVFAYDADFAEAAFTPGHADAPGLVGMRVLDAPVGTSVLLNSWAIGSDWSAGTQSQSVGFGILTGSEVGTPDHAHEKIGHLPASSRDVRMAVTAGPLTLAPGDSAVIVVAIAVAPPAPGTFTTGTTVQPGDPLDPGRALHAIAAQLRARMDAAASMPGVGSP